MKVLEGTFFYDSIESAFAKIHSILPAKAVRYLQNIQSSLKASFTSKTIFERYGSSVDTLFDAVIHKKVCNISYHTAHSGEKSTRLIEPLKIWFANNALYLVAFDRKSNEQRTFAVARIETCEIAPDEEFKQMDFDFQEFQEGTFRVWRGEAEEISLIFGSSVSTFIQESIWHESQSSEVLSNGDIRLKMKVAITPELEGWVLSWGEKVMVEGPHKLRENIIDRLGAQLGSFPD